MPPQRRKIVPPTTTSKARRKVAGSGRTAQEDPTPPAVESDVLFDNEPPFPAEQNAGADDAALSDVAAVTGDATVTGAGESEPAEAGQEAEDAGLHGDSGVGRPSESKPVLEKPVAGKKLSSEPQDSGHRSNGVVDRTSAEQQSKSRTRVLPVVIVGALAVLLIAFATVAALKPGTQVDNAAWVDQGATSEVTRAATDGITALYRYNYETIDDDLANAATFMSPAMQEDTSAFLDSIKSNARQTQTATDVDVMDIGVTRLEEGKAEVLANVNVSSTRAGVAYGNAMFPLVVNLEKIDDKWVVSATQDR